MSPAKSRSQANLMRAAAGGATFPKAQQIRQSMTLKQIGDFASTPTAALPMRAPAAPRVSTPRPAGRHPHNPSTHPIRNLKAFAHPPKAGR